MHPRVSYFYTCNKIFLSMMLDRSKVYSNYLIGLLLTYSSIKAFNPIPGGRVMQICITLYIFFNTDKAQLCTNSKLFDF